MPRSERSLRVPDAGVAPALTEPSADQFYTGLVAELYEPLLGERSRAEDYLAFLDRSGTPALELACGSGLPMVELVKRGYEVEGLDASQDMLDRCRERAQREGVEVTLHRATMESFELPRRYRSIFLAGASFTLLPTDEAARRALARMHAHLEPGGGVLIPLEAKDPAALGAAVGRFRETRGAGQELLRVGMIGLEVVDGGRGLVRRLRYERIPSRGDPEVVERDWRTRSWSQTHFREMLVEAGFEQVRFVSPAGGPAAPDADLFVALARQGRSGPS